MRLLLAHNFYQQAGGEDAVFSAEADLLRRHGHEVVTYVRSNDELRRAGALDMASALLGAFWSPRAHRELGAVLERSRPDAALFVNAFPLLSPSAYAACRRAGVPVLQFVGNYRLVCPAALLYRDGVVCEQCLGRALPWPAAVHACYRGSVAASAAAAALCAWNGRLEAAGRLADWWIAPTAFHKNKLVQGGIAEKRIRVRPNILATDLGVGGEERSFALFVGRLTREKGLSTLLAAWDRCPEVPLRIAGAGPEESQAREHLAKAGLENVRLLGWQTEEQVAALLRRARFLVLPSECYEGLPMTLLQAFSTATPVLASRIGGLPEVVGDGGQLFEAGDAPALADAVHRLWSAPEHLAEMGAAARRRYEELFSAEPGYRSLIAILQEALDRMRTQPPTATRSHR